MSANLLFSYRFGKWKYWNHVHSTNIMQALARSKKYKPDIVKKTVREVYRHALDISFRRSGGLIVILRSRKQISQIVNELDQLESTEREETHRQFDNAMKHKVLGKVSRRVFADIAALDGGVIVDCRGIILAYAAVLLTKDLASNQYEGSRTKAAIAASEYGVSIKISSDGDITIYERQKPVLRV